MENQELKQFHLSCQCCHQAGPAKQFKASTKKQICEKVGWLVGCLVGWLVGWLVGKSVFFKV